MASGSYLLPYMQRRFDCTVAPVKVAYMKSFILLLREFLHEYDRYLWYLQIFGSNSLTLKQVTVRVTACLKSLHPLPELIANQRLHEEISR